MLNFEDADRDHGSCESLIPPAPLVSMSAITLFVSVLILLSKFL